MTITGNYTIDNLSNGFHSVIIYAKDTFGNIGASVATSFTIAVTESFPVVPVAAVSIVVAAVVVAAGLLVYHKKHCH